MPGIGQTCPTRVERFTVKVRIIEGEPSYFLSEAFLQTNLRTHDAVVIIKDKAAMNELVWLLAESLCETTRKPASDE